MLIWSPRLQTLEFRRGQAPDRPAVLASGRWSTAQAVTFLVASMHMPGFAHTLGAALATRHAIVKNREIERSIAAVARLIASGEEQVLRRLDPVVQVFFDPQSTAAMSSLAAVRCATRAGMLAVLNEPTPVDGTLAAVQQALADRAGVIWLNAAAPVLAGRAKPAEQPEILEQAAELIFRRALLLVPSTAGGSSLRLAWMRPAGGGQPKPAAGGAEEAPVRTQRSAAATSPAPAPALPPPSGPSPQADALVAAAQDGVPFCAECAAAKAREDAARVLEDA